MLKNLNFFWLSNVEIFCVVLNEMVFCFQDCWLSVKKIVISKKSFPIIDAWTQKLMCFIEIIEKWTSPRFISSVSFWKKQMSRHYFLCYILISCKTYCRKDSSSSRGGEGKLNNINCCVNNVTTEKSHIEDCLQVGMPTVVEL